MFFSFSICLGRRQHLEALFRVHPSKATQRQEFVGPPDTTGQAWLVAQWPGRAALWASIRYMAAEVGLGLTSNGVCCALTVGYFGKPRNH